MTRYSYSRLTTFETCQRAYQLSYLLECDKAQNAYGFLGGVFHDQVEALQLGDITNEQAVDTFFDALVEADFLGYQFPTEKSRLTYQESLFHALKHFKPLPCVRCEIEKEIHLTVDGAELIGYIDAILHHEDGTVSIVDFKTSSKYSKKELPHYANQLLLYAVALEREGYRVRDISWLMLKYVQVKTPKGRLKVCQRNEVEEGMELVADYQVFYPLTEETKATCLTWVKEQIKKIETHGLFSEYEANGCQGKNLFYCQRLCGVSAHCDAFQQKNQFITQR